MKLVSVTRPILAIALLLSSAPAGAQSKEQKAGARAAAEAGGDAFDAGRYAEAADLYERAERLVHAPPHLLYAARAHVKLGHLVEARELYLTLTREQLPPTAPRPFRDAQQLGEKELEDIDPRVPYVSIVVQGGPGPGAVRVTRNGEPVPAELLGIPTPVNPGTYSYQAFAEGMESTATSVKLAEGVRETVVLTLRDIPGYAKKKPAAEGGGTSGGAVEGSLVDATPSDSGGAGSRPLFIGAMVSFGVAAVGGGLGTYFFIKSGPTKDTSDALFNQCDPRCTLEQKAEIDGIDDDFAMQRGLGITGFVAAGLGLATGVTLVILDSNRSRSTAGTITPVVGLNYVGVSGSF